MIACVIATKAKPSPTKPRREARIWSFAEVEAELPESNQPTELWDGDLIMSPSPSFELLKNEQYRLLGRFRSGQTAESRLLPGFKIAVDDLFACEEI